MSSGIKRKLRSIAACDFCKRRRLKCIPQGGSCVNCLAYNETCQFTIINKKRGPSKGYTESLENRIELLEKLIQSTDPSYMKGGPDNTSASSSESPTTNVHDKKDNISQKDEILYATLLSGSFFHSANDCPSFVFLGNKFKRDGLDYIEKATKESSTNTEEKNIVWPSDIDPVKESTDTYIYSMTGVDRHTSSKLLKIYFGNIHPTFPIIDKTEFVNQYRNRHDSNIPGELLNSVFGAAARFLEHDTVQKELKSKTLLGMQWELPKTWSIEFFDRAEHLISYSLEPSLAKLQAILLVLHHRKDRNLKVSISWQLVGLAIRIAHFLGLQHDCDLWNIPYSEKETRKRVWWTLYITDVFQSSILGRPVSLKDEDMSVGYPDATASWEEVMDAYSADKESILNGQSFVRFPSLMIPVSAKKASENSPRIYELFLQLISLSRIVSHVLLGLHTPQAKVFSAEYGSDHIVAALDQELKGWRESFSESVKNNQLPDFYRKDGHFAPTVEFLQLFYYSTLILLHQPFIKKKTPGSSLISLQICASAASLGIKTAYTMSVEDFLMFPYSFVVYPLQLFSLIHVFIAKNPNPQVASVAKDDLLKGYELLEKVKTLAKTATLLAMMYNFLIEHLYDFEKNKKVKSNDKKKSASSVEENVYYNNFFSLPEADSFINQFTFEKPQINVNEAVDWTSFANPTISGADEDHDHIFKNDPFNLFWSLPNTFDLNTLSLWLSDIDDVEWLPLEQNHILTNKN